MTSLVSRAYERLRRPVRDDSGFSLLEAVVALMVATVAFTALAAGAMSAIRGSMSARQNQQAADFMGRRIEELRLVDFGGLANRPADLPGGDSSVTTCGSYKCVDPGTGVQERIVADDGGAIDDHVTEVQGAEANRTGYTLKTYVTAPNWAQRDYYRRLTVVVTWRDGSTTRVRRDSTIVTYTQRGLPLPVFKLTPIGSSAVSVNRSATVVYGLNVTNQGAPDRFDLTHDDTHTWAWLFDNGDGVYDASTDTTAVTDTDGNGTIDTGKVDPNGVVRVWLVRTIGAAEPDGVQNVVVTGTSRSQPTAEGGVQSLPFATTVVTGVVTASPSPSVSGTTTTTPTPSPTPATDCAPASSATGSANTGYTLRSYTLHNDATPGNTTAQQSLAMAVTAPYATTLYEYSTDVLAGQPGRVLQTGGTAFPATGSTDPRKVADWRFPVGAKAYSGTAGVNLWVAPTVGGSLSSVNLTATVYKYTKSGSSYAATALTTIPLTVASFSCSGFQQVGGTGAISVPTNGSGSLGPNDWIGLRVVNNGTSAVRVAYDVLSVYPAAVALPEK
jgi:type II secretory pathway pseudopilin PulG